MPAYEVIVDVIVQQIWRVDAADKGDARRFYDSGNLVDAEEVEWRVTQVDEWDEVKYE